MITLESQHEAFITDIEAHFQDLGKLKVGSSIQIGDRKKIATYIGDRKDPFLGTKVQQFFYSGRIVDSFDIFTGRGKTKDIRVVRKIGIAEVLLFMEKFNIGCDSRGQITNADGEVIALWNLREDDIYKQDLSKMDLLFRMYFGVDAFQTPVDPVDTNS